MPQLAGLLDVHGRPISHAEVKQSLRISVFAGALGMIWMNMTILMPVNLFLEAIGAGGVLIGLLTTARLLASCMQIPAALLSERLGARKPFMVIAGVIHRMLWFGIAALALCWKPGAWWLPYAVIAVSGFSDLFANATGAAWFSWMTDLVPGATSGRFWGRRQSIVTIAGLGGMALAGYLMDTFQNPLTGKTTPFGFAVVFAIAAVCGTADILLHMVPREPMPGIRPVHASLLRRILAPLDNPDFRRLIAAMGLWTFGATMIITFSYVYLKRFFPVTYTHVSALMIAFSLGIVTTGFSLGSLIDRIGARKLTLCLFFLAPLASMAWFFVDATFVTFRLPWLGFYTLPQVIVVQVPAMFLTGIAINGMFPCQVRLMTHFSSASGRTVSISLYWTVVNLVGAIGAFSGGCLMDWFTAHPIACTLRNGTGFSFFHVIVLLFAGVTWLLAAPLIAGIRTKVDPVSLTKALGWQ